MDKRLKLSAKKGIPLFSGLDIVHEARVLYKTESTIQVWSHYHRKKVKSRIERDVIRGLKI